MNLRLLALTAVFALAACGGGGGGTAGGSTGNPPPVNPPPTPQYGKLTLSWQVGPAGSAVIRNPRYVSPNAADIEVKVNTVNGSAPPSWVPADAVTALVVGGNCTLSGGTETCTVSVAAPPGSVSYTINILDGPTPGTSKVLSTITTTQTIVQGTNNTISLTLSGVVKTVSVSGSTLAANNTSFATTGEVLTVTAFDPSGAQIVNGTTSANYNNPPTLTDNDPTGQTALTVNGGTPASTVTVNNPSDVVRLNYTGQALNNFTISPGGTGISCSGGCGITTTVNDITFTGTTLDNAANGGLNTDANWGQQTLFFSQASGTQNLTGAELGWTNASFSKQFSVALTGCSGIASISSGPATTFTVTALGVGVCSGKLTEPGTGYPITQHTANVSGSATHDGTFWISVTTASIGVNSKHRK